MKKSKTISLSKFIVFLFFLSIIYTAYFICEEPESIYNEDTKEVVGVITQIDKIENGYKLVVAGEEKIIVYYYGDFKGKLGYKIKISGELSRPNKNTVFNLFNYRDYLKSTKIYWQMQAKDITVLDKNEGIYFIKNSLLDYINQFDSYKYLKAFILGIDDDISNQVYESYQINGISHLLAISGSQITLLSLVLLFILNLVFKNKKFNYLIVIILLLFYMFLTGFLPPIVRATLLFVILTIRDLLKLSIKTIYLLLLIAVFYLFYNAFIIMNVGFLFSFIICFYLILFGDYIKKVKNYIFKTFVISLIAFLGSIPILIYNFHYINLLSPFINLIFVPLVTFLVYPLSLIVMIIRPLDEFLLTICNFMENISLYISNFDKYILILRHINVYIIIFYYSFITLVIYQMSKRKYLFFLLFIGILFFHANINYFNTKTYLTMIDVGQGDCFLLVLPHNKGNILIDTGGEISFSGEPYDLSDNVILPYLRSEGISKLDYLIITHGDFDHVGMASNIIENFSVSNIFLNSGANNTLEKKIINKASKKNINIKNIHNYTLKIDEYKFNIMSLNDKDDENADSLIIYTKINGYKMLMMGDAGLENEEYILNKFSIGNVDILKVGHHGSKTSSSKEFINNINPKYSLISVGKNNMYGHPNKEVLDTLNNSIIYRTDIDGSIKFKFGNKLEINSCPP